MSSADIIGWVLVGVLVLVSIIVSIISLNNSKKFSYPNRGDYNQLKTKDANLTYYYTIDTASGASISTNVNILTLENTQNAPNVPYPSTLTQTIWSPLSRSSTDFSGPTVVVGNYESFTEIYQTDKFIISQDISSSLHKNGLITLVINDTVKNLSGSINFILANKTVGKKIQEEGETLVFINDTSDTQKVFEITGGTGDFLGKKGYIYVNDKLTGLDNTRGIYIYYN